MLVGVERGQGLIGLTTIGTNIQKSLWQKKKLNKKLLPLVILQNKILLQWIFLQIWCIQQLCGIELKVVAGFSETHTAVVHLPRFLPDIRILSRMQESFLALAISIFLKIIK